MNLFTVYPPFWPALQHNLVWLGVFLFIATPIGIFFAVLLDKNIRGTRIYQSAIYLPVVLSLAIVGFIWQLQYAPEQGFLNNILGTNHEASVHRAGWVTRTSTSAAVLVAASWRHIGYIMVLYLAGLKSVDPSLREAAAIDGASERQTFFRVVLPVLRPINIVILVITIIESLRAFDIVYVINKGLERPRAAVGPDHPEHRRRVVRGSGSGPRSRSILLIISVGPIILFLTRTFEEPS